MELISADDIYSLEWERQLLFTEFLSVASEVEQKEFSIGVSGCSFFLSYHYLKLISSFRKVIFHYRLLENGIKMRKYVLWNHL